MADALVVRGGEVLTPRGWEKSDVVVEGGKIRRLAKKGPKGETVEAEGARVLPGLIDLQVNGAFGKSFASASAEECADVARRLAQVGTTAFLAALVSLPEKTLLAALGRVAEARAQEPSILGAHLEGPFLNPDRAGAHLAKHLRKPTLVEFTRLATAGGGVVKMMTLAPETEGALSLIAAGVKRDILMSAGHTMATRAEFDAAVRGGLKVVTHLFNAMRPLHHRTEGVLDGALVDDRVWSCLIYDRQHVSRAAAEIAWRCKPREKLILVSDSTAATASPDGDYELDGVKVEVKAGRVTVRGSGRLGGSSATLLEGVRNFVEDLAVPFVRAWELASVNPARLLGLEAAKGAIAPEYDADLVVLEEGWKIRATVVGGRMLHGSAHPA
jgi:N-acetylglucosamine-6-phosphate deacetylase